MVLEFLARRMAEPPLGKAVHTPLGVGPFFLPVRSVRNARGMNQAVFDAHRIFAVGAEFRNILGDAVVKTQRALLHHDPGRGCGQRLGRRHDDKMGVVGGRFFGPALHRAAKGLHGAELAVAGNSDLAGRQQAFFDLTFGPVKQGLDFFRVKADFLKICGKKMCGWHVVSLLCGMAGIVTGSDARKKERGHSAGSELLLGGRRFLRRLRELIADLLDTDRKQEYRGRGAVPPSRCKLPSDRLHPSTLLWTR